MNGALLNRLMTSALLIGGGSLLLLDQHGRIELDGEWLVSHLWPLILIYIGMRGLLSGRESVGVKLGSLALIGIGGLLLWNRLTSWDIRIGDFLPYALPIGFIAAGLILLSRGSRSGRDANAEGGHAAHSSGADAREQPASSVAAEGGPASSSGGTAASGNAATDSTAARGYASGRGTAAGGVAGSSLFGDTELDLTREQLPEGEPVYQISHLFGNVKVLVPADANLGIRLVGSSLAGGFYMETRSSSGLLRSIDWITANYDQKPKRVLVKVSLLFGDVRVERKQPYT